jgi:hypothetical protein
VIVERPGQRCLDINDKFSVHIQIVTETEITCQNGLG